MKSDVLPFPFNIRQGMPLWNWLFFKKGDYAPDPTKSPEWNRGAYLVLGPGHCGACHTPKNFLGGDETSRALDGDQLQGWFAPNITGDRVIGIGGWSVEDIASYLKTGHNPSTAATGIMGEEVGFASSHMSDDDLRAIAAYLKSLPGQSHSPNPVAASDPAMTVGEAIYADRCSACHARDGRGVAYLFPALAGSANVHQDDPTSLIRVLLEGARSSSTAPQPTGPGMPAFGWQLNDEQAAAALTYVRNSWGGAAPAVTADEVKRLRGRMLGSVGG